MNSKTFRLTCWLVASACFLPAWAGDETGLVLEEVIVTATLREVALQDLPQSVGVLTGEDLLDVGAVSIDDIWRQVPNLAVRDGPFGGRAFAIRGLADSDSFQSTESINAFYVDDTAITYVSGLFATPGDMALLDLERVEVMRGPQGTLVGANAMGGAVRMITHEPKPDQRGGRVEINVSDTNHGGVNYGGNAVWNLPTGPDSALRFAALYQDDSGFIDDIGLRREDINSQQRTAGRVSWLWGINERWESLVRIYAQEVDTRGFNYADDVGRPWSDIQTTNPYEVVLYSPELREEDINMASVRLTGVLDWGNFYSATSWYQKDLSQEYDWSVEQFVFFDLDHPTEVVTAGIQEDYSQEFRIYSPDDARFSWLLGAYYLHQKSSSQDFIATTTLDVPFSGAMPGEQFVYLDQTGYTSREDLAVFGELGWQFTDQLNGVVGVRWYDSKRGLGSQGSGIFYSPGELTGSSDGVVPKVSLSWNATDQTMAYGLVSKGFRPGQFNVPAAVSHCGARSLIDDDELTNYELGIKHTGRGGAATINISAYRIDWDEMQFNAFDFTQCPFPVIENVGSATSQGFEADFQWRVMEGFRLQGGLGYNDAHLDSEWINDAVTIPAGTRIPFVPEWTASIAGTWDFDWASGVPGYIRADAQYVDNRTVLFDQASEWPTYERLDAYTLANVRAGILRDAFQVELFITNLFDKQAETFCCRNFFDPAVNRPRTIGLRSNWSIR